MYCLVLWKFFDVGLWYVASWMVVLYNRSLENRGCGLVFSTCKMDAASLGPHANLIIQWAQWDIVHQRPPSLKCLLLPTQLARCCLLWPLRPLLLSCGLNWFPRRILYWAEFLLLEIAQIVLLVWFSLRLGLVHFLTCSFQVRLLFL